MKWLSKLFHGDYSKDEFAQWASMPLAPISNTALILNEQSDEVLVKASTGAFNQVDETPFLPAVERLIQSEDEEDISLQFDANNLETRKFSGDGLVRKDISISGSCAVRFDGLKIGNLRVSNHDVFVEFCNCQIHTLLISMSSGGPNRVSITNCEVGTLSVAAGRLKELAIRGGSVLNFATPAPHESNPFVGSVSCENVGFPRTSIGVPLAGSQPYRNMRAHLNELHNTSTAGIFHAAEQAVDLESDGSVWNRLFGYFYWGASDFGSSLGRPLVWLLILSLLSVTLLGSMDGAVVLGDCETPIGWYGTLCGEDGWASMARGFVMGFQPISFFGALLRTGSSYSLIAANVWVQAWLVLQGLTSGVLLTLFILALRRRFKLGP